MVTLAVGHGVEEAPRRVGSGSALDEGDVVRRGDADDGEEFHVEARDDAVFLQRRKLGRNLQRLRLVRRPLRVAVHLLRTMN